MKSRLVISIDYDDTWTEDPDMWLTIAELMRASGHVVVMCTARVRSDPVEDVPKWIEVFYSEGKPKAQHMSLSGLNPSIWIDDMPHLIGSRY